MLCRTASALDGRGFTLARATWLRLIATRLAALLLALVGHSAEAHWTDNYAPPSYDPYQTCSGDPAHPLLFWSYSANSPPVSGTAYTIEQMEAVCWSYQSASPHGELDFGWVSSQVHYGEAVCSRYDGFTDGGFTYNGEIDFIPNCVSQQYFVFWPVDTLNFGHCKTCPRPEAGEPINTATGNSVQTEIDYQSKGPFPLAFGRVYNSEDSRVSRFGQGWRQWYAIGLTKVFSAPAWASAPNYSSKYDTPQDACVAGWAQIRASTIYLTNTNITASYANGVCTLQQGSTVRGTLAVNQTYSPPTATPQEIDVSRRDGSTYRFIASGNTFVPASADLGASLQTTQSGGYQLTEADDTVELYNSNGVLQSITSRGGVTQTIGLDAQGRLGSVSDSLGRSIQIGYDANNRFGTLTDPDNQVYTYHYNGNGDVDKFTFPDGKFRQYYYEDTTHPRLLTGIGDENGHRFVKWTYDAQGRAYISELDPNGVDAERTVLTFNSDGTTTVKDGLLTDRTYAFRSIEGTYKPVSETEPCSTCASGFATATTDYYDNGNVKSRTDFNGNVTKYDDYELPRNLEKSRTEAFGSPQQRTITTQWDPTYRLPAQIDEPGRRTNFTYYANGDLHTRTVLDTTTNDSRTTTYTYSAFGQIHTIDGPRTDVSDVTTFDYYSNGNLHTITNALNQVTTIDDYDAHGNPKHIVDPNGVETTLTYDLRQRLKTRTVSASGTANTTTAFDYDGVGQLTKVTLPDLSYLVYSYDAAHRLTDICDHVDGSNSCNGNRIHYTLDKLGNRTVEDTYGPTGTLKRTSSQVFDALSRLHQIKDAGNNVITTYGYDGQGNRTSAMDADSNTTAFLPDALNRIKQVTDAKTGITQYGYNALDQLTSVTDAKNLATAYTINALGDVAQQVSPDTGTTNYTYDSSGNRRTQTDARGVLVTYSYDKLNRLTFIDYAGTNEDVTYLYDGTNYSTSTGNGIGRLTGIIDQSGTTTLIYDARGNVSYEKHLIGSTTYTTSYTYDGADRVATTTYPSGRVVTYERNSLGQIDKVTTTLNGTTTTVADNVTYLPFGDIASYTLGNGIVVMRSHDQNYRISELKDQGGTSTIQDLSFGYYTRGDIHTITDLLNSSRSQTFGYDELSRLTSVTLASESRGFTYDGVGNRLTESVTPSGGSTTVDTYTYPSSSHRLSSRSSGTNYGYDGAGNITGDGAMTLAYNLAGRLSSVTGGSSTVTNTYSSSGLRIKKNAAGVNTVFHYDRSGHLLAEEPDSGVLTRREYIWLGDLQLAVGADRNIPEVIVDNGTSGFSTQGTWNTASNGSGYYGTTYARHDAAAPTGPAKSLDDTFATPAGAPSIPGPMTGGVTQNTPGTTSYTGNWITVAGLSPPQLNCYSYPVGGEQVSCYLPWTLGLLLTDQTTAHVSTTSGTVFSWHLPVTAGRYRVYASWPGYQRSGNATFSVVHRAGTSSRNVNQAGAAGSVYLGIYDFDSEVIVNLTPVGSLTNIPALTDDESSAAVADVVTIVPVQNTDGDKATWSPPAEAGRYEVFARWPSGQAASTHVSFTVKDANGTTQVSEDQNIHGGQWNSLGTYSFDNSSPQWVTMGIDNEASVFADAIRFVPVASEARRTEFAYVHSDHLGVPRWMTDSAQNVVWSATYEAFGKTTVNAQPHFDNPLRFPGQYFDAETGLYQNWNRDYDPSIGRYLQSDPIGLEGGLNSYAYVKSNPLRGTDPKGLFDPAGTAWAAQASRASRLGPVGWGVAAAIAGKALWDSFHEDDSIMDHIDPSTIPPPANDGDYSCKDHDDDPCVEWYQGLFAIYQGILNGTEAGNDLTKQAYNNSARRYNRICGSMGHLRLPLFQL